MWILNGPLTSSASPLRLSPLRSCFVKRTLRRLFVIARLWWRPAEIKVGKFLVFLIIKLTLSVINEKWEISSDGLLHAKNRRAIERQCGQCDHGPAARALDPKQHRLKTFLLFGRVGLVH